MKKIIIIILYCGIFRCAYAEKGAFTEFDDSFIQNKKNYKIDISDFYYGNPIKKGNYEFDIYVNGKNRGYDSIFIENDSFDNNVIEQLCITPKLVELFDLKKKISLQKKCNKLNEIIPYSTATINLATLRLNISLPQAVVKNRPSDYVPPFLWDDGITAGFVSYNYLNYNYYNNNFKNNDQFLSLNTGINLFGWNFRHDGNYTKNSNRNGEYTSFNTYVEHDIDFIKGQLTIGDFITKNNFMSNFSIRGIQIASEQQMKPQSERGFFPDIRGIANTNARVQIKQKNNIIYEKVVPPGPFIINDLYSTPYNGDIEVSVLESDGSINKFIIPYASTNNMLRPGNSEYQISFGRYRNKYTDSDYIINASYQYGINNSLTINSGGTISSKYKSSIFGLGLNLPIGSLSSDITYSEAKINNDYKKGYTLHADYSVTFDKTNTYLSFAAFRFSSKNYFTLDETMNYKSNNDYYLINRIGAKNQYQISLNQPLPDKFGSLYFNAYQYNYWNNDNNSSFIQLNYNNNYSFINYSFGITADIHNRNKNYNDNRIYLSISIPLNFKNNTPRLYTTVSHSNHEYSNTSTISDSFGDNNQFSYSLSNSNSNSSNSSYSVSTSYNSPLAKLVGSLSTSSHGNNQNSIGVSGGVVIHPYGITLANSLGDSFAVIHANKGYRAKIDNSSNNYLDWFGNGIYNYLTPYEFNNVGVNIKDVNPDVQFNSTQKRVVPRANSILLVNLETKYGDSTLINLTRLNGDKVPMGASVLLNEKNIGTVAQDGQIYIHNIPDNSILKIDWGDKFCEFTYNSQAISKKNIAGFHILNEICKD